jgi:hypothetical protein
VKKISIEDIPDRTWSGKVKKSEGRLRLDEDLIDFAESEDEAAEVDWSDYAPFGGSNIRQQRSTLDHAVKQLGLKGFKVVNRGDRLFVVKEENFE